jgi:Uma2 family endonuclease
MLANMASGTLVSEAEYLASVYRPDCEYVDGEVLERNLGETDHGSLQIILGAWFRRRRKEFGIYVFGDTRTQVAPHRYRVPDLAITTTKPAGRILDEPPLLCIEIVSPEDRLSRMEERIKDYLAFGVRHVWLIDPRKKLAWSYTADGNRRETTVLTTDSPRIELPVDEVFAELAEELGEAG